MMIYYINPFVGLLIGCQQAYTGVGCAAELECLVVAVLSWSLLVLATLLNWRVWWWRFSHGPTGVGCATELECMVVVVLTWSLLVLAVLLYWSVLLVAVVTW